MLKRLIVVIPLVFLLAGCGILRGGITGNDPFRSGSDRRLAILIENANPNEVGVVAVSGGRRHDLGRIAGRTSSQLSIPWRDSREVRFQIVPITGGGRQFTTRGYSAHPGDFLNLVVLDPIDRSFVRR